MRRTIGRTLLGLACVAMPSAARADLLVTPYIGVNFGGKALTNGITGDRSSADSRPNLGGSLTWVGTSGLGFEFDVGFIPDFFKPKELKLDLLGSNNVTTVMGNVMFARAGGGIQPYVVAGAGLLRSQVGSFGELLDATDNGFGVNAGAGVRVGPGRFSVRGDVRYFRNLSKGDRLTRDVVNGLSFFRATAGLSIGF